MARRYDDGDFFRNEPTRRKIRDEYRDKFFSEMGGERSTDPFDFQPDMRVQIEKLSNLVSTALPLLGKDAGALSLARDNINGVLLGVDTTGLSSKKALQMNLQRMSVVSLDQVFFTTKWTGG